MFLKNYYSVENGCVAIDANQASLFAKEIAGDFNPIHDPDSKRFCVPGDLLFSLVLEKYGLSEQMMFTFSGMVGHGVRLKFPSTSETQFDVADENGKTYLKIERSGKTVKDEQLIAALARDYVAFSGQNFPYVLVPLLKKENVMINLDRPLVIYDCMSLKFSHLNFSQPYLEMLDPEVQVSGKRGSAHLHFQIKADDKVVGSGYKKLAISGLRQYDAVPMQAFVDDYLARKEQYLETLA